MKIRQLNQNEPLKKNEYKLESATSGDLAIKIDSQKIHNRTLIVITIPKLGKKFAESLKFNEFIKENSELLHQTIETEIEYVLDTLALVFCTVEDDFKHIRKNFYKFNNRLEDMITALISKNVKRIMFEEYKKEMNL